MSQGTQIDPQIGAVLQSMVQLARQGRMNDARKLGRSAAAEIGNPGPLNAILGRFACECGDFADGISELNRAIAALPDDPAIRCDLVAAHIQLGQLEEALAACDAWQMRSDRSQQLGRLRGYAAQQLGRWPEAIEAYRYVVAAHPDDGPTWNNLGNSLSAIGDYSGAIDALQRAVAFDRQSAPSRLNLANAHFYAGDQQKAVEALREMTRDFPTDPKPWAEMSRVADWIGNSDLALEAIEAAAVRGSNDPEILVELANQRGSAWDTAGAEQALRQAIDMHPQFGEAYAALAVTYEHGNRPEKLPALIQEAEQAGVDSSLLSLIRGFAHRRDKNWQAALDAGLAAREDRDPVRRAQLIAECMERLGRPDDAFAWYETMNRLVAESPRQPREQAKRYSDMVDRNRRIFTDDWLRQWTSPAPMQSSERASPVFLLGFPRSGTTLLDTMLMGHPDVQVMEEKPALVQVEHGIGDIETFASMNGDEVRAARSHYWHEVSKVLDLLPHTTVIDKSPLYLNKVPIIHRLFPDARFILALRHPLDVVLSCYVTNFRPNPAMANFLDLRQAADLYNRSMSAFFEARELLNLPVHTVRYEAMVADRDRELKPLFDWLGLDWRVDALDHQTTAAKRGAITTASYAQVHEPLYTRSAGRWTNFRKHLEPVIPILRPWVERLGYSLGDEPEGVAQ